MLDDNDIKFINDAQKYSSKKKLIIYTILLIVISILYFYFEYFYLYKKHSSVFQWELAVFFCFLSFYSGVISRNWLNIINKLSISNYKDEDIEYIKNAKSVSRYKKILFILSITMLILYIVISIFEKYINILFILFLIVNYKSGEIAINRRWLKIINKYYDIEKNEEISVVYPTEKSILNLEK